MDRFSRRSDQKVGIEKYNDNQVFIKDCWLHNLYEVVIDEPEVGIIEKIKVTRSKDKEVIRGLEEIKRAEVKIL